MSEVGFDLGENDHCQCQNCDWTGPASAVLPIKDFSQRVAPGERCPAGECPECGALCHTVKKS